MGLLNDQHIPNLSVPLEDFTISVSVRCSSINFSIICRYGRITNKETCDTEKLIFFSFLQTGDFHRYDSF